MPVLRFGPDTGQPRPDHVRPRDGGDLYDFGGWFRNTDGNFYSCSLITYTDLSCTQAANDSSTVIGAINGSETAWTYKSTGAQFGPSVRSAYLQCDANSNTYIDKLFLSTGGF
jgi:hypothetical protein